MNFEKNTGGTNRYLKDFEESNEFWKDIRISNGR
jgi:hypothetical protein